MILQKTGQSNCLLAIDNDQIVNQSGSAIPVRTEVAEERERGTGVLSLARENMYFIEQKLPLYIKESPTARKLAVGFKMHNG